MHRKFSMIIFILILPCCLFAATQRNIPVVNVLQWWGYLSSTDPYVTQIENECNVKISYDQFYSNDEFIRRIKDPNSSYDISIFSYTVFNAVKDRISDKNSQLYKISENYNPIIRKQYQKYALPHNVLFFIHSLTGFLYNPDNITISNNDGIFDLLQRSKGKIVVMIDDPVEAEFILSLGMMESEGRAAKLEQGTNLEPLTIENFEKLYRGTKVVITNMPGKISDNHDFAFAFQWSGDAIELLKNNDGRLKFFVHQKLSYITTDLIATLNNNPATVCVAEKLAGKKFLDHEQNRTYYFSPYADGEKIKESYFKKVFNDWDDNLKSLPWITSVDGEQFKNLDKMWSGIKLKLVEQQSGERSLS